MKIFEMIQRNYVTLGVSPLNQWTEKYLFNGRILFGVLLFGYLILSQVAYIFRVASEFTEYVECISTTSASFIILVSFAAIVHRKTTLFECIANMEKLINTCMCQFQINTLECSIFSKCQLIEDPSN